MPRKSSKSRREPLTRDRVIASAVALADAEGLDKLSMRSLGRALGVEAMSLYNHVRSKDDVLDGMVERVVGEIACPDPAGDWRDEMRRRAHSAHTVLLRHPWAGHLLMSRAVLGPNMLGYVDATIGTLRAAGFDLETVDHAWNVLDSHIYGFTLQELNFPFERGEISDVAASYLDRIPAETFPHVAAMTRHVATTDYDGLHDFAFGLELILDGLERKLARG